MGLITNSLLTLAFGGSCLGLWALWEFIIRAALSPINKLPGAPSPSWLFGHSYIVHLGNPLPQWQEWAKTYGYVAKAMGPVGTRYVVMSDCKGVKEMLTRYSDYVKPYSARITLSEGIGAGLVVMEGENHKRQRKLLNMCFYPATIKQLTPIFYEQSNELRDVLYKLIDNDPVDKGRPVLDMYHYFLSTVLNMIGLAGFDYYFDAHNFDTHPNELHEALQGIYRFDPKNPAMSLLRLALPDLHRIPSKTKTRFYKGLHTFERLSKIMLDDRKKVMFKALDKQGMEGLTATEQNYLKGRDLLSALVKANADPSIPDDQRLSDEEVVSQIKTFLVAGHETTATGLAWTAYELACHPEIQSKLREELIAMTAENPQPSIDDLNALPYLDGVMREAMRLRPAIPYTMRVATKDDVIPLQKSFVDTSGKTQNELHVWRGDMFVVPIEAMNRYTEIWGPDADEFKPERWAGGELKTDIPGVWSSMLTFLGGPRSCIGYRFAIYEMKIILFTLLPLIEFELMSDADDIASMTCISRRPYAKSQIEKGFQMPLRVKRYVPAE